MENKQNLGFTATVNKGMNLSRDTHKILLNSDTIVYDGWLDRILAHAFRNTRIGTITPLSNNATIFSYPDANATNNFSLELSFSEIDHLSSFVNAKSIIDVPTGVGFCMFIHRDCFNEVGEFDVETFNRGYGEENDFCMRAGAAGWRNVAAADVYIRHTGEVSFALDAATQQKSGYLALIKKHPTYESRVRRFVSRDLLRQARQQLDLGRLLCTLYQKKVVIFITHNHGGGIETHLGELTSELEASGYQVLLLTPNKTNPSQVSLSAGHKLLYIPNLQKLTVSEFAEVVLPRIARAADCVVHLHSFVGFELPVLYRLLQTIHSCGLRVLATVHDYSPICPRNQLVDDGDDYCGLPPPAKCNECLANFIYPGMPSGEPNITLYRELCRNILGMAERVFVPSSDTKERLAGYLPQVKISVRNHLERDRGSRLGTQARQEPRPNGPFRIVTIGAVGPHKGSNVIWACAANAASRSLPLQFHIVGFSNIDERLQEIGVKITGPYHSKDELVRHIDAIKPDIAFLPSIWPETYLYTLSDAFELGLYPVAFDVGAQGERIHAAGWGALIAFDERFNSEFINDTLLRVANESRDFGMIENLEGVFPSCKDLTAYYGYANREGHLRAGDPFRRRAPKTSGTSHLSLAGLSSDQGMGETHEK
jgi:glycosyltransferase involved in cell wall biosynthesis